MAEGMIPRLLRTIFRRQTPADVNHKRLQAIYRAARHAYYRHPVTVGHEVQKVVNSFYDLSPGKIKPPPTTATAADLNHSTEWHRGYRAYQNGEPCEQYESHDFRQGFDTAHKEWQSNRSSPPSSDETELRA